MITITIIDFPEDDREFEDHILTKVDVGDDSYTLNVDGMCLSVAKVEGVVPKVGSRVRYYGRGFGYPVRGVFVDGKKIYYRTIQEQDDLHAAECAARKKERQEQFVKNKDDMDRRVAFLPDVFQRRLARFRAGNPEFRVEYEGYELFTCEQAVVFAEALKTTEALQVFAKAKCEEQLKMVPGMNDGHSGNTFGCAVRLAHWFLVNPENVVLEHGAMVPLVGCRDYGCTHDAPKEEGQ